jgi:hypothetical protein
MGVMNRRGEEGVIKVDNLGKVYNLGSQHVYSLKDAFKGW